MTMTRHEYIQHIRDVQCFIIDHLTIAKIKIKIKIKTKTKKPILIKEKKEEKKPYFISCEKDQLFWIYYIIAEGMISYNYNKNNRYEMQQKMKYGWIDQLHQPHSPLKENIKQNHFITLSDFEDQLVFQPTINLNCFLQLSSDHSILLLFNYYRMYYKHNINTTLPLHVIHIRDFPHYYYGYEEIAALDVLTFMDFIKKHYFETHQINTPFQPCNKYKVGEIKELCRLHKIPTPSALKKNDLYQLLNDYFFK